ncbi:MAG TPA: peptidylprolyl isomerase [Candidatus Krumholzibacteria bacterium]|nr:peptidylprolyl isomerase [Candidatus Krumholzibacteria bacterium]HPD73109.1 peptidylprolyl isomerase [Candidatus Krumholzibacteria bacterium]HRY41909.1 peptidylprolyl isomerase [Candidatus Krumholzibacteria bacterium]
MKILVIGTLLLGLAGSTIGDVAVAQDKPAAKPALTAQSDKAFAQVDAFIAGAKIDKSLPNWKTTLPKPPAATFDPSASYYLRIATNKGPILIEFMPAAAPMHVTNFIYLAKLGFFDGLKFHRVIPGFMAQGGDPLGTGTGGPGYQFSGEISPDAKHDKPGILSMAHAGPGTDGSQFFITFGPTPHLDGQHTVFGEVVEGLETLKNLEAAGSRGGAPSEPLIMEKVTVEVKKAK